jgi:hypothetical protein
MPNKHKVYVVDGLHHDKSSKVNFDVLIKAFNQLERKPLFLFHQD